LDSVRKVSDGVGKVSDGVRKVSYGIKKSSDGTRNVSNAVLPSRSALSDLGLIADLFEKMLQNWSSFCLKSPLFGQKGPKSLIFHLSAFKTMQKLLENFLKS